MVKRRTVFLFLFILSLSVFFAKEKGYASGTIESIDLEAVIQRDGSVHIRDHRVFYAEEGTEHFVSFAHLGESELLDFVVYDQKMQPLENAGDWDVDWSFEEKAGRYGVNWTIDGFELCFGLGDYGRREFTLDYTLSNFVFNLSDGHQGFYWSFLNKDMDPIDRATVTVKNDAGYTYAYPKTRIWAFGFDGKSEITKGALTITAKDFTGNDYMVVLSLFEGRIFDTGYALTKSSEDLIGQAFEGTGVDPFEEKKENTFPEGAQDMGGDAALSELKGPMIIAGGGLLIGIFSIIVAALQGKKRGKRKRKGDVSHYRDVPGEAFHLTQFMTEQSFSDVIAAFILKWLSEGRLDESVEESKVLIFTTEKLLFTIASEEQTFGDADEAKLWEYFVEASKGDGILQEDEFNEYAERHSKELLTWFEDLYERSKEYLNAKGYYVTEKKKFLGFIPYEKTIIQAKGDVLKDQIDGFKRYLEEYSLVGERDVSQVGLWESYMIWAAYLGIAEEVCEQLKIVDPERFNRMGYSPNTVMMVNHFAAQSQRSAFGQSGSSVGGAGGASFGGGGGGSFGGGSGGGSR